MKLLLLITLLLPVTASATTLTFDFSGIVARTSIEDLSGAPFSGRLAIQSNLERADDFAPHFEASSGSLIDGFSFNAGEWSFVDFPGMMNLISINRDFVNLPDGRVHNANNPADLYAWYMRFHDTPSIAHSPERMTDNPGIQIERLPSFRHRRIIISTEYADTFPLHIEGNITEMARVNDAAPVPEPATALLLSSGLGLYAVYRRRKKMLT